MHKVCKVCSETGTHLSDPSELCMCDKGAGVHREGKNRALGVILKVKNWQRSCDLMWKEMKSL